MASLDDLAAFVRVVELGSFTAAARDLGLPRSTLSRRISLLERHRDEVLLHRTTRKVETTPEGLLLFEQASAAVARLQTALTPVRDEGQALRVAAPRVLRGLVLEALGPDEVFGPLLQLVDPGAAPDITLSLALPSVRATQRVVEVARLTPVLAASPAYLARHGTPRSLGDLDQHRVVVVSDSPSGPYRWPLFVGGQARLVPVQPGVVVPERVQVPRAVRLGLGLGRLWRQEVADLTPVLPGLEGPSEPVWALMSGRRGQEQRIARALELVRRALNQGTPL